MENEQEQTGTLWRPTSVEDELNAMDGVERATPPLPARFTPARLEGTPELPEPGLYFGMSDEEYHALPALSNHGIKYLVASPMIFWSRTPWLSKKKQKEVADKAGEEKLHHTIGKAYHCRVMEGREEFHRRFVVELDPEDYPNALVHTDQIKAAIARHTETVPVKPKGRTLAELSEQLTELGVNPEGMKADQMKATIGTFTCEQPVKPVQKVTDTMPDSDEEYQRQAVKADWIKQLLELEPDAKIFDEIQRQFLEEHAGKLVVPADAYEQIEVAAAMVERDPEVKHAFKGGYAEVVLIWYCPRTGVPMKAKVDYLKVKAMVDLKTVTNQRDRSIEQAIRFEISGYHYNFQPRVYTEGAQVVRELIRNGEGCIHIPQDYMPDRPAQEIVEWAQKWASHRGEDEWLWVFQQKGDAPVTRGVFYPLAGLTNMVTGELVNSAKKRFRQFSEAFGTDPWLDTAPIYLIADEDIPASATEI